VPKLRVEKLTSILAVAEDASTGAVILDKAVLLARAFGAHVDLIVTDTALIKELAARCSERVYYEVTLCSTPLYAHESLQECLLRLVAERRPDIVVKAPASPHPLRSWTLQTNDAELVRDCPVPVLLAGMKTWATPVRVAALVDASTPETALVARGILQSAGFVALGLRGWLDILYVEREMDDERLRMERAVRLAQLVREYHVGCERLQMFDGDPQSRLPPLIHARKYDLLVIGTGGRSLASKLFEATEGDVLLAKASARGNGARFVSPSTREEIPDQAEELV
jgi:nucleotide-binding universal stress UspA family protein